MLGADVGEGIAQGIQGSAKYLRDLGVPDWKITPRPFEYGTLNVNPLPLSFGRVRGNSSLVNSEVSALQRVAANNRVDTGSAARMMRIDELTTANYNRILSSDLANSDYVYRLVKSSDLKYYEAANAISGRGGSPTYFSLDTASSIGKHIFGAQMKPGGYDTLLRIPTTEIVSPLVPRAFGYANPGSRPTFGREYFTNSYPEYGYGGFRQFEATTRSYSSNWIVR
ncbi:hypothetical protein DU000_12540 [Parvibium lacunae]|uniref:Uncharacterized protein n=1 Tax=Parvibium lacunae TaxID=1888893 RepID=A0A368KZ86_9BURK|nr:hypothetical protein DU000_12540 [Parvibium lacunae]